jgi:Ca2+-binding RTX toxin-like protein
VKVLRRLIFAVIAVLALASCGMAPVEVGAAADSGQTCAGEKATYVGTGGNDVFKLTKGHDVVVTLGGDDRVYNPDDTEQNHSASDPQPFDPPANDDIVCLGEGNDYAKGARTVYGWPGNDTILRAEEVYAGPGDDTVRNDGCKKAVVYLEDGTDRYRGFGSWDEGFDPDNMGNSPYNKCKSANDEVHGGPGDDTIYGGDGDDRLFGDDGKDSLNGWMGKDTCKVGSEDKTEYCESR